MIEPRNSDYIADSSAGLTGGEVLARVRTAAKRRRQSALAALAPARMQRAKLLRPPDVPPAPPWLDPTLDEIASRVSALHELGRRSIRQDWRDKRLILARQHFCYLARKYTVHSAPEIARWLGRHHSTVLDGAQRFSARLQAARERNSPDKTSKSTP